MSRNCFKVLVVGRYDPLGEEIKPILESYPNTRIEMKKLPFIDNLKEEYNQKLNQLLSL